MKIPVEQRSSSAEKGADEDWKCNKLTDPCLIGVSVIYLIGIVGNLLALVLLCRRKSFRNSRHSFMLKCLISNNLIGIVGMISQMYLSACLSAKWTHFLCIGRVLCRTFGLNSGCVALVMALERFWALTTPLTYQQRVSKRFLGGLIFGAWAGSAVVTCLPFVGFGVYFDATRNACVRYREAKEPWDVVYAYLIFVLGIALCIGIAISNLSVTKELCQAHYSRRGSTTTLDHHQINIRRLTQSLLQGRCRQSFLNFIPTSEEIRFAKLMLVLSLSFVLCWCPQMITILLFQLLPPGLGFTKVFAKVADVLLLLHFVADPYIYVLLKQRRTFNVFFKRVFKRDSTDDPSVSSQARKSHCLTTPQAGEENVFSFDP